MKEDTIRKLCIAYLTFSGGFVMANGFRLPDQHAQATARGEAFAATADNASAIYYNPAGIGLLKGHDAQLGVYALAYKTTYDSPAGTSSETEDALIGAPHFFYSYSGKQVPIAVGLGLYAPFGLSAEWPEDTGFRTVALKSEMSYLTVNPVVAWRVLTNLSLGIGPTFNYSKIELKRGILPYPNYDISTLEGDSMAFGFNAGILWQPHQKWSFGVTYRSRTEMDYDGHSEIKFFGAPPPGYPPELRMDASAEVPFPQSIVAGISFRPTPKWNIEFDIDWTDWDSLDTVGIDQAMPASLPLNYQSSFYYELGVTHLFDSGWQVSAGYIFNENSVPDKSYNPWVPDQDRHFVCVGVGYQGDYFSFDFAYQFGFGASRSVTGNTASMVGQTADGDYEYMSHGFALTAGWRY